MNPVQPRETVTEEWRELESDPGLFSLLIEEFGVRGVKVEEVYDVSKKIETKVYGYVFLFRYELGDRRARKKARDLAAEDVCYVLEPSIVNSMFFAHQIIVNSCATHALLSVLLNCPEIKLGSVLTELKQFSSGLDPESKGFAIANMVELSRAHNKHARPSNVTLPMAGRKGSVVSSARALMPETYHFVSYVPINGRLFELDGLKEYPIDHGPWGEQEDWTNLFQRTISFRLAESENFLFNLMALIPDPSHHLTENLRTLSQNQDKLLIDILSKTRASATSSASTNHQDNMTVVEITRLLPTKLVYLKDVIDKSASENELKVSIARVLIGANSIKCARQKLKEHLDTMQRYQIEHSRRVHDYEQFITEFVRMLAQNNQLPHRIMKTTVKSVSINHSCHRRRKGLSDISSRRPKTTLLVNGTKVN